MSTADAAEPSPYATPLAGTPPASARVVRQLRQQLLWPLRVMPQRQRQPRHSRPWELLQQWGERSPWRELVDEYAGGTFQERHYAEFVTFLPYVQQFLYGEGRRSRQDAADSPMRTFRRRDVKAARFVPRTGDEPIEVAIQHVDLIFFYDVDVVLLNVELVANELLLEQAQDLLYRFGRAYPSGWLDDGQPMHAMASTEWLGEGGVVLARSDSANRDDYLAHVSEHRAPQLAAHWAFMLHPLVLDHSDDEGALRVRQIEYYRMPTMAYLAIDEPQTLPRADFVRLGLVTGSGDSQLPYSDRFLANFERRYCYDRFWCEGTLAPYTRYMCCGHALVVVGDARSEFYTCGERGVLAQFRHQHFLLFLIAHFQKAALLMFSDRLVEALKRLDISDADSVRRFKRAIRGAFEGFLRFTHRYWFHEVSEQAQVSALFRLCTEHLKIDELYVEVKERLGDMGEYLDADSLRRQANTVVRLTVVTIAGLIGTTTTGFLGMNLLAEAEAPLSQRIAWFAAVLFVTLALTVFTMIKSKRLSDFLDALSDERLSYWQRLRAFATVWRRGSGD